MSLYRFGFKRISIDNSSGSSTESQTIDVPDCMPSLDEARGLGLGEVEYKSVLNNASDVVMNSCKRQRIARGKYTKYSNEDRHENLSHVIKIILILQYGNWWCDSTIQLFVRIERIP